MSDVEIDVRQLCNQISQLRLKCKNADDLEDLKELLPCLCDRSEWERAAAVTAIEEMLSDRGGYVMEI